MSEYPEYRLVLEELRRAFNGKGFITLPEIAKYDGICTRTAASRYRVTPKAGGLDICILAHRKCENARK